MKLPKTSGTTLISSEIRQRIKNKDWSLLRDLRPGILAAHGNHGFILFRRDNGRKIGSTDCDCPDCPGAGAYHEFIQANVYEFNEWVAKHDIGAYASRGIIDILDVGLWMFNGTYLQPSFEHRRIREK